MVSFYNELYNNSRVKKDVALFETLPNSFVVWLRFLYPLLSASYNWISLLTVTQVELAIVGPSHAWSKIYN